MTTDVVPTVQEHDPKARERWLDKELLETREALEEANRLFAQAVDESAEKDHIIARQKDQLAKARAQVGADIDERMRDLELEMSGLIASLAGAEKRLAEHKLIDVALVAMAEGDTPLERLKSFQKEYLDLERSLEGARADAETKTRLLEVVAQERDELREEVLALREEVRLTRDLVGTVKAREEYRRRACDSDLLDELRTLLLTHGETLEAAGADHVYYLYYRVSQALEGEG